MYKVEVENKGGMLFTAESKDYRFDIDLKGKGMSPPDVFLAGLASCIGVYLRKYLDGAKLGIEKFKISADAELSTQAPVCFKEINIKIDTKDVHLDDKRKLAVIEFIKNCPVHNTIKNNPEVKIEVFNPNFSTCLDAGVKICPEGFNRRNPKNLCHQMQILGLFRFEPSA